MPHPTAQATELSGSDEEVTGDPLVEAERCVAALRTAGYAGADLVGFVSARSATLEPITLDLTGERLAQAVAGLHAARPRAQSLEKIPDVEKSAL